MAAFLFAAPDGCPAPGEAAPPSFRAEAANPGGQDLAVLFDLATPPGGEPPANLLQALSNIARYPEQHVAEIFALAKVREVYLPPLVQPPDAWTLVVKVNDTGSDDHLFGGPGDLAFDADGYAWVTNNVVQGTPYSSSRSS